ncbi:helix-turn-helix transcriptional regulator [Paenibacillus sp. Soil724D2]|uniref:helix-turn-helix transcriptional regulator n=1 Tax=Paenibacillus sp. (strain Soil724D2) TaxID=1736392 RepID=UPI0012E3E673|nr:helix-turn-helix transcriptional regulator [Paenibacillus sp. Soil724D2]
MKLRCRLKAVLADIGMSHTEFAEKMGVSQSTVSAWNKGSLPTLDKVYMIEEVTGTDLRKIWVKEE